MKLGWITMTIWSILGYSFPIVVVVHARKPIYYLHNTQSRIKKVCSNNTPISSLPHRHTTQKRDWYESNTSFQSKALNIRGGSDSSKAWSLGATPTPLNRKQSSSSNNSHLQYPIVEDVTEEEAQQQATKDMIDSFLSRDNRNSFIARVYSILTVQLIVTALSVVFFSRNPQIPTWMATEGRMIVPFSSIAISSITLLTMTVSEKARQQSPLKWLLLSLFTLGESTIIGFITSFYPIQTILSAFLTTAAATGSVTMYTLLQQNSNYDLSQTGRTLASASIIFALYGVLYLFTPPGFLPYSDLLYSMFGAILFSFYLSYHTRLIVAGEHSKYRMNHKDYVYGAMTLYGDIINIFLYILRILGGPDDD